MSAAHHIRVLNVDNGPGANGLRGGIKEYNPKTATGQWMEMYGGPMGYKRGFTSSDFQTEAQHAQLGANPKPLVKYGAEIPILDTRDEKGNELSMKLDATSWETNSKATHPNFGTINKNDVQFILMKPRLSREKLLEYRRQWTTDKEANRKIRFRTESRIASSFTGDKFTTKSIRLLPGTPKSLEEFRNRLIERYGIFAMSAIRYHIGNRSISCNEFRKRIRNLGVEIKAHEFSQILAYITPSSVLLSDKEAEDFYLIIKGHIEGFSTSAISQIFFTLCNDASDNLCLPINNLIYNIDSEKYPDVMKGFKTFLPAYCNNNNSEDNMINLEQFIELHDDMFVSSPQNFEALISDVWKII